MGYAAGHLAELAWAQLVDAPFRLVDGRAPELEPDLVVVASAVEAVLLALGVVGIGAEVNTLVMLRSACTTLARHADEVVEHTDHRNVAAALRRRRAHQTRMVALDD